ncbi:MAG: hypothetical protein MJZ76_00545 [Bacteroidales bacterium]|nr:hypothetical protein [Bacteroidales bacterium]
MKNIKVIALAFVACTLLFASCKKTDLTKAEMLSYKYGWVLDAATTSPAYALSNGTFCTDLMTEGYLQECELDDIIKFDENGAMTIIPKETCDFGYQSEVASTWKFNEAEDQLTMQIPFFYNDNETSFDEEFETCELMSLTEDELKIKFTFNDNESASKGVYSFTLTYRHATKKEFKK